MRYLPLVLVIVGLTCLVALMAGPGEKGVKVAQSIGITLAVLVALAMIFGLVANRLLQP